jgi:hypothetical protein
MVPGFPVRGSIQRCSPTRCPSRRLGPHLPDIAGAVVSFGRILPLLRFWRPKQTLGFGGVPVAAEAGRSSPATGPLSSRTDPGDSPASPPRPGTREAVRGLIPFGILTAVVARTGPWSHPIGARPRMPLIALFYPWRAAVRQATMSDAGGVRGARHRRLNKAEPSSYHLRGDEPDKSTTRMVGAIGRC